MVLRVNSEAEVESWVRHCLGKAGGPARAEAASRPAVLVRAIELLASGSKLHATLDEGGEAAAGICDGALNGAFLLVS